MPSLTYAYVYFANGPNTTRAARHAGGGGGFTPIPGVSGGSAGAVGAGPYSPPGSTLEQNQTDSNGGTYKLAFVTLLGGVDGPQTSLNPISDPPSTTVGSDPIVVLLVYFPSGGTGTGNGTPGASIDAFDETSGNLIDDSFVKVAPDDKEGSLTNLANLDGWVDTSSSTEQITAISNITPSDTHFDYWVDLENPQSPPPGEIRGHVFTATEGATYYALAFYRKQLVIPLNLPGKLWPTVIFEDPFGNIVGKSFGDPGGGTVVVRQGIVPPEGSLGGAKR
jgi:hypothetical protein